MELLEWIMTVIVGFISIVGILLVLMQSSRGGGGLFGDSGGQNVIGMEGRGDLLSRLTSVFIGIFIVGSLIIAYLRYQNNVVDIGKPGLEDLLKDESEEKAKDNKDRSEEGEG